jgi:hypothetical protein
MSSPDGPSDELRRLLATLADGLLSDDEDRRLADLLRQDRSARDYYLDYVSLQTSLQWEYATAAAPSEREQPPMRKPRVHRFAFVATVGLLGVAAGLLLAIAFNVQRSPRPNTPVEDRAESADDSIAVVLQSADAEWAEPGMTARSGSPLPPGRLLLKAGSAHIQFYCGATVVLEGPADFRLISPQEAFCARGKVRATVPPQAQGFTIGTPKLELVDVGTEFGLQVGEGDKTEVHVFRGKVELYNAGAGRAPDARTELTTGHGLRLDGPGAGQAIASDPAAFLSAPELAERSVALARQRYEAWRVTSDKLRHDPRVLLYYTFQTDQPWDRTVPDQVEGRQPPRTGAVVGCEWVTGRWPGKWALEFKRPGDRVRVNVPGEHAALTLMTWVRIDALEHNYTSLLLTDRWRDGSTHWQITQKGELILNIKHSDGHDNRTRTRPVPELAQSGQWVHLAAVYDDQAGEISQYVNGQRAASFEVAYPTPLRIGPAEIGNWGSASRETDKTPVRNLNGRMDEFLMFDQALSPQEVQEHYQAGKPNP